MDAKGEDVSKTELTLWTENEAEAPLKYTDYKPKWSGDQLVRYLSEFEMVVCVMCRYALNEPPGAWNTTTSCLETRNESTG